MSNSAGGRSNVYGPVQQPKVDSSNDSKVQVQDGQVVMTEAERDKIFARLDQLEKELEAERQKALAAAEAESGRRVSNSDKPLRGEHGGWKFKVGPEKPSDFPGLEPLIDNFVDEAEAKRFYINTRSWPLNSGIALDPIAVKITVECIDDRRKKEIVIQRQIAIIRAKLEKGQSLTPAEAKVLEGNEARVYNFA